MVRVCFHDGEEISFESCRNQEEIIIACQKLGDKRISFEELSASNVKLMNANHVY
jgi:hypothetical protein